MTETDAPVAVIRGGGDLATGAVQMLKRAGFLVLILEAPRPSTVRRTVALSTAVDAGTATVEDMTAVKIDSPGERFGVWDEGRIPVLIDPDAGHLPEISPDVLIDAMMQKRSPRTVRAITPKKNCVTIALGPGFTAPEDADAVIETMRGHNLGRVIRNGSALPPTGVPGEIGGKGAERIIRAPVDGAVVCVRAIGDRVEAGDILMLVGGVPAQTPISGVLRGMIADGFPAWRGLKCADVDPRPESAGYCFTVSDKARCIGGAALGAVLTLRHLPFFREKER